MVCPTSRVVVAGVTVTEATGAAVGGGGGGSVGPAAGSQTAMSQKYSDWLVGGATDFQGKWISPNPSGPSARPACSRESWPLTLNRMTPSRAPGADSAWR